MLPIGKLDSELLKRLVFSHLNHQREEVTLRAALGEDCAVLNPGGALCVLSTDPITGAGEILGRLAVHVNCNDIAAQGVAPVALMLTLLAPAGTTAQELEAVMSQAAREAARLNVEIIGGHTEITTAVNRMVVSGVALGLKAPGAAPEPPQPGDLLVMTKTAGLEGTGILLSDCRDRLSEVLTPQELEAGVFFLDRLSVVPEGVLGGQHGARKLHDVTEGGIHGAVWELCHASGLGCRLYEDRIPVHPLTAKICGFFGLNPYRLISSGTLLLILPPPQAEGYLAALDAQGIPGTVIGEMTQGEPQLWDGLRWAPLEPPGPDELFRVVG